MRTGALVLVGVLFGAAALLPAVSEGKGGGTVRGGRCGQTECRQLGQNCPQDRKRLRDGSCGDENCPQNPKGCGNQAASPQDGSGTSPAK
jgi:hypothetical protein